jgi:hypothetical protein
MLTQLKYVTFDNSYREVDEEKKGATRAAAELCCVSLLGSRRDVTWHKRGE